ncbi:DUF1611 domain-containing protein [Adhaeretor mobilis]|uniref:DUF1611 domain-containing protein n=1 Tax=Adhaeretor mobilis TaxID=1930276 RepID=A0A517MTQ1_9BACT|nr:DUF1611 domain-containing protein [Adhaeretor mobilis]QDS98258.1 hypothetical protein HG15A2_15310 [Adhaeretor mobilis]
MATETRKLVILTEGQSEPITAKTAVSVLRYRPEEVVALIDSTQVGKTTDQVLAVGGKTPFVASLKETKGADALMIGIAPAGGKLPEAWRKIVLEALEKGMDVVSGLHQFLSDDAEFVAAAEKHNANLIDVRQNSERDVANWEGVSEDCLRIHAVGQDCCVGKMVVCIELDQAMKRQGVDSKFVATGQTGILVEGDGCPIDCVVSDFISGAAEKLVLANQHHDVMFIEGQGSLAHPRYSAVTLGLLHGCRPHGMILCYEVGRTSVSHMQQVPLKSLAELRDTYEHVAGLMLPSKVIGVAMNSRLVTAEEAEKERERVRAELGVPVCDVIRHGPDDLIEAVINLRQQLVKQ